MGNARLPISANTEVQSGRQSETALDRCHNQILRVVDHRSNSKIAANYDEAAPKGTKMRCNAAEHSFFAARADANLLDAAPAAQNGMTHLDQCYRALSQGSTFAADAPKGAQLKSMLCKLTPWRDLCSRSTFLASRTKPRLETGMLLDISG